VRQHDLKAVKSLFQATEQEGIAVRADLARPRWSAKHELKERVVDNVEHAMHKRGTNFLHDGRGASQGVLATDSKAAHGSNM
jgi:hypothetical protein